MPAGLASRPSCSIGRPSPVDGADAVCGHRRTGPAGS